MFVKLKIDIELIVENGKITLKEYSSNLTKTITINLFPETKYLFTPRQNPVIPKPVLITPLFKNGKLLASIIVSEKEPSAEDFRPTHISTGKYTYYISIPVYWSKRFISVRDTTSKFTFKKKQILVKLSKISIVNEQRISIYSLDELNVDMITPTILKDPFLTGIKYAAFLPVPDIMFAVPAKLFLRKKARLINVIPTLRKILIPPHTITSRLRKAWYLKRSKKTGKLVALPALYTRIVYKINKYNVKTSELELVENIVNLANIVGVGRSRAAGFGSVNIY